MPGKIIGQKAVTVVYASMQTIFDEIDPKFQLMAGVSYGVDFANMEPSKPREEAMTLSLFDAEKTFKGSEWPELAGLAKEHGLKLAGSWEAMALVKAELAEDGPLLISEQSILVPWGVDFTHDPQFERAFLPAVSRPSPEKIKIDLIGFNEFRKYGPPSLFLTMPGTGQPELLAG